MGENLYTGAALAFADNVNGVGRALSGVDCGVGVPSGAKCFVATGSQYWTLKPSAAPVNHVTVERALNFPAMRWILDPAAGHVHVGDVTELSALPTLDILPTATVAFVNTSALPGGVGSQVFMLVPAITPAANTQNVADTSDDPSRQWVALSVIMAVEERYVSENIKLSNTGQTNVVPGIVGKTFVPTRFGALITVADAPFNAPPTFQIGNPSSPANMLALTPSVFDAALFAAGVGAFYAGNVDSSNVTGLALLPDEGVQIGIDTGADAGNWQTRVQITGCYI